MAAILQFLGGLFGAPVWLLAAVYASLHVLAVVAAYFAYFVVLWLFFLASMSLDRQLNAAPVTMPNGYTVPAGLQPVALYIGLVLYWIGRVLNLGGNLLLTAVFLEIPRELACTVRVTRWIEDPKYYSKPRRVTAALFLRMTFMDGFDRRGVHRATGG